MSTLTNRRYFGKEEKNLPELDLISVQKDSWKLFIDEAIAQELAEISPIDDFTGKNWQLILENPRLGEEPISPRKAAEKGLNYSVPIKITATLINKRTGDKISQNVFLGDIPQMTSRGTFVINGIESDGEILTTFAGVDKDPQHKYIEKTLEKDLTKNKEEALLEIYRKMRPG